MRKNPGSKLNWGLNWTKVSSFPAFCSPIGVSDASLGISLDDQICRLHLTATGCPLGPLHCPLRHTQPSAQNFQPPKQLPTHPRERERLATVCKHWLRGLCKKGDACEFLHEYNLRRMPECWWYAKYGYCSAGDECLYAHPKERRVECPDYKRGFCKLGESVLSCPYHAPLNRLSPGGPTCPRKHVRRVACQLYLTGFCPSGPDCPRGQYVTVDLDVSYCCSQRR